MCRVTGTGSHKQCGIKLPELVRTSWLRREARRAWPPSCGARVCLQAVQAADINPELIHQPAFSKNGSEESKSGGLPEFTAGASSQSNTPPSLTRAQPPSLQEELALLETTGLPKPQLSETYCSLGNLSHKKKKKKALGLL